MSIRSRLANWVLGGLKESSVAGVTLMAYTTGQPVTKTDGKYESNAKEGYSQNPYVFAACSYIARACAGVPWKVTRVIGSDTEATIDKHPILDLLAHPNPEQGRMRFVEELIIHLLLGGDAYIERVGPDLLTAPPRELYNLRPDRMTIIPGRTQGLVQSYRYQVNGNKRELRPELVKHLKLLDPLNDFYGMSPARPGSRSIDQNNDSRAWNDSLLQNGGRPSGAFVKDENLTTEQFTRLQSEIESKHSGSARVGKFLLLEGGLKFQEIGLNPKDMDWLEGQKLSAREIAIVYNVPPELLGDSANKTYSNYQEARKAFYQETVLPLLDYLRDELNMWLVPLFGGNVYLDYNSDEIEALQEDRDALYTRANAAYAGGLMTRNEARALVGLAEDKTDPESDAFKQPSNSNPFGLSLPKSKGRVVRAHADGCACGCKAGGKRPLTAHELSMAAAMQGYFDKQQAAALKAVEGWYEQ